MRYFFGISFIVFSIVGIVYFYWPPVIWTLLVLVPVFIMGVEDIFQVKHGIRRNFPIIGNLRYFFEAIRPELQQYFVESNLSGRPIPREFRSIVYQRAKGQLQTLPFGTQRDVDVENYTWINHSLNPKKLKVEDIRVVIGGKDCQIPYSASLLNISAMSYGALSGNAIKALNLGAKRGGFYHNTGEGSISKYHLSGGDLVWQIGTGYFGCRTHEGDFDEERFKKRALLEEVKMIEIKLSQGAKPGKGGLLPGKKVTPEIAEIREVPLGKDVESPPYHTAFSNPKELLQFVKRLRDLTGGKPVGFKLCVGKKVEFISICKAMVETGIRPDFITVDGSEGGTGAAPLEFSNSVGMPLEDGLSFVHDCLVGFNLREDIKIIAAGKSFTAFHILKNIALGADIINSARGMMLALGCIQALSCNTNRCPAGVATTNPQLARGLHVPTKELRVSRFHSETVHAFVELLGAMGYERPEQIKRKDVFRRMGNGMVKTFDDIFPCVDKGLYLDSSHWDNLSPDLLRALMSSSPDSFDPELGLDRDQTNYIHKSVGV